jgi:hypothetical protein
MIPDRHIWVFNGGRQFPGGIFTTVEGAETWIRKHRLTGVLTAYPVDEGCFEWAVRCGVTNLKPEKLAERQLDAQFIGGFSTASQEHFHYENGERA